jgi:hypothetical protein
MAVEYVFPCYRNKTPAVAGGFHAASNDPKLINRWRWNYPLMAAPTGPVNDFDVLDLDVDGGLAWLVEPTARCRRQGSSPQDPAAFTTTGSTALG